MRKGFTLVELLVLLGTMGKLIVGAMIVVVTALAVFVSWL